jgi:glycosyltransferase involved in cell wall biosynthesis
MAPDAPQARDEPGNPDVWLVVPLYNEAEVIRGVIKDAARLFDHIVCVDDGSRDDSAREAAKAGAIVVRHPVNLGQGAAIQTGVEYALVDPDMRYVVTFDADGQHRPEDAEAMVGMLRLGQAEIVFGSRFLDQSTDVGWAKAAVLKTAAFTTNVVTRVHLTDTHNGLRAFSRSVATRLDLKQNRMAHASEFVTFVGASKFRYAECPVTIVYSEYSKSKGQSLLNSINIMTEILFGR